MRSRTLSGIPTPVSPTDSSTPSGPTVVVSDSVPPVGIASTALRMRLVIASRSSPIAGPARHRPERRPDVDDDTAAERFLVPARLGHVERIADDVVEIDRHQRLVLAHASEILKPPHRLGAVERRALDDLQP